MDELSVVASCDGCGACCMSQGSPPGYVNIITDRGPGSEADVARVAAMPVVALAEIIEYMSDRDARLGTPCCWLEMETRSCRYYEHRPSFCRHGLEHPFSDQTDRDDTHEHAPWIYPGNTNCVEWREIFAEEVSIAAPD